MEWAPPTGSFQAHNLAGGLGRRPALDYARLTHREYGHRVGIFRVLEVLRKHGIPVNVAMDALTAEHYPFLVEHCQQHEAEFIGHGMSVSRMITSRMSEDEERDYIRESLAVIEAACGIRPSGWFGPEYGESLRTPGLLAEAGLKYVLDWTNDEQPYPMTTPAGGLHALPVMLELDDVHALADRNVSLARYARLLVEASETLSVDGATNARTLVLHLHPWLIGQPFRIRALDRALGQIVDQATVCSAYAGDIVDWAQAQEPGSTV
ncbi:MAG: polysaccharide deacetylase family protein [Chromatiales bacterium]|jgi:allantoinase|nr:polysaccharide deacetylase family protein [Chromatiales bacterium]